MWKKKPEETAPARVPYYLATVNGLIVSTVGEQPVKTLTLSQAFNEVERIEENAKSDYQAGHVIGAEHAMDSAADLRKAIRVVIDTMENLKATDPVFYF